MACNVYTLYFIHYDTLCTLDHSLLLRVRITDDDDGLLLPGGDNYITLSVRLQGSVISQGEMDATFLVPAE